MALKLTARERRVVRREQIFIFFTQPSTADRQENYLKLEPTITSRSLFSFLEHEILHRDEFSPFIFSFLIQGITMTKQIKLALSLSHRDTWKWESRSSCFDADVSEKWAKSNVAGMGIRLVRKMQDKESPKLSKTIFSPDLFIICLFFPPKELSCDVWRGVDVGKINCLLSLLRSLPYSRGGLLPSKSTLISPGHPVRSVQLPSDDTLLMSAWRPSCAARQSLQKAHLCHLLVLGLFLVFTEDIC